jgi:hypothetical protein
MDLRGRLQRLQRFRAERPAREITIAAEDESWREHGTIEPWENGRGFQFWVSEEYEDDPIRGLTQEQRDFLREGDRITALYEFETDNGVCAGIATFTWRAGMTDIPFDEIAEEDPPPFVRH